jgi:hypothetical protein
VHERPLNLRRSRRNAYRRAPTCPVEDLPSHLTTAAHAKMAFLVGPRMHTSHSRSTWLPFRRFMSDFFLEDPKLRSDLCGSWIRASPASAFLHLHMALHLAVEARRPGSDRGLLRSLWDFFRTVRIRGSTSKHGVLEDPAFLGSCSRRSARAGLLADGGTHHQQS